MLFLSSGRWTLCVWTQTAWGWGGIQVPPHVPSGAVVGAVVRGVVRNSAQCQCDIFTPPPTPSYVQCDDNIFRSSSKEF